MKIFHLKTSGNGERRTAGIRTQNPIKLSFSCALFRFWHLSKKSLQTPIFRIRDMRHARSLSGNGRHERYLSLRFALRPTESQELTMREFTGGCRCV